MTDLNTALTPLHFLDRAARVHPDKVAVVDGPRRVSYRTLAASVSQIARALRASGIRPGDRVAYLATNSLEMLSAHFAVPLCGGILVAINTRLAPPEVQYICDHSGSAMLFGEAALLDRLGDTLSALSSVREVVVLSDAAGRDEPGTPYLPYTEFLARQSEGPLRWEVDDELATISLNYTSGTTARPKGVIYTHRGAYLNALNQVVHNRYDGDTRYLWTLPMFHCNGWCNPWAVVAVSGTQVCLRAVRGDDMWGLIDSERVTHMSGAPTVLTMLAAAESAHPIRDRLSITTAGAPPSPTTIGQIRALGAELVHVYGLTETYGPYAVCEVQPAWQDLDGDELARRLARQGVGMLAAGHVRVVKQHVRADGELIDVAADGVETGEIVMRGHTVMKGYYLDDEHTAEAFAGGWFHSGDLGVMHPDGYVQVFDRAKDVIISGGENISSIDVEQALMSHPTVSEVAVVGVPDPTWGERPRAFVVTVPGAEVTADDLIAHTKQQIASFKAPRDIVFVTELPKTSTGKTRKNELRSHG